MTEKNNTNNMKKRVSFITVHVGSNFGSNLQAIATSEVLRGLDCEPVCVNYIPPRTTYRRYWQTSIVSLKKFARRFLFFPLYVIEKKNFEKFLSRYCNVSKAIYRDDDFSKVCPKADVYMTGSDQVWNFTHNEGLDSHYFFEGIKDKKIAFSSSIGKDSLPEQEQKWIEAYTKEYSDISVREKSAVKIFEEMGRNVVQVLDPTMMLNKNEWYKYAKPRLIEEHYLYVYFPYNIADEFVCYRAVKQLATKYKLKVVSSSFNYYVDSHVDKTIRFADPGDFLSLMIYADFIVTNSFHGTAFSINLHKDFFVFMPSKFSTRITSVLEMCNLEERLISGDLKDSDFEHNIDWNKVEKILAKERVKALSFLKKVLE